VLPEALELSAEGEAAVLADA